MELSHHINQALKAKNIMKRDIDYVVQNGEVLIVDEFTGRIMQGRRYSEGLHQAIEAKENLVIRRESKTLATITFQNYFRMYEKLSGMTGTAKTEESEFREIYGMDVVVLPTNKPVIRNDLADSVYVNGDAKFSAIVREVKKRHEMGQPVLVGTISIEKSEELSRLLKKEGVKHEVLNAKYHEREAEIVSQAGRFGAVTIATNMAGRGTDIVLGGNPEFLAKQDLKKEGYSDEDISLIDSFEEVAMEEIIEGRKKFKEYYENHKIETDKNGAEVINAGGLCIVGTERHESRRIDNQLRGRSGRQGDPGDSKFFISLDDDLMRLFGGERIKGLMDSIDSDPDEPLEHKFLTKAIENAQGRVESNNFGIRKHVLQYDDVMNKQREVIYGERRKVLEGEDMKEQILSMVSSLIESGVDIYTAGLESKEDWDLVSMLNFFGNLFLDEKDIDINEIKKLDRDGLVAKFTEIGMRKYDEKEAEIGSDKFREIERIVLLQVVDSKWMDHIDAMDQLRQGIGLRAVGQMDPVIAYQNEGYDMFEEMNFSIKEDTVKMLYHIESQEKMERRRVAEPSEIRSEGSNQTVVKGKKVGRNDPCPCGSGKKYKKCCGQ